MSNKFILTSFVLVSVTILSGCGDNKSKKAAFRPKGGAITMKGTTSDSCDIMSPGGASSTAEQCKAAEDIVRANAKPECKASWKSEMTRRGCSIDPTLFADTPSITPTGRNDDRPPGTIETTGTIPSADGSATPQEVLSVSATDPQTGDIEVAATTGSGNTDGVVPVPAAGAAAAPAADTTSIPAAGAGTTSVPSATAGLVSAEELARFRADDTSCPKLNKINQSAINFASSLDIAKEDPRASLNAWARRVCINDPARAPRIWSTVRAEIATSSTWTAADQTSKCSTELGALAIACSNSVRYGGKTTTIWGTRLTAESSPAAIAAAAAGEVAPADGAAPAGDDAAAGDEE